jgi:hypothetical protein
MSEIVAGLPGRAPDHASNWRIRQVIARTRWQLVTFCGAAGGESVGVVDMIAIRKDHGKPLPGTKRGGRLQIILIQVKGGKAAMPSPWSRSQKASCENNSKGLPVRKLTK